MADYLRTDQIVSKSTQTTGRSLILISAVAIFTRLSGLKFSEIGVFKDIGATEWHLATATGFILIFLMTSHYFSWRVDKSAYDVSDQELKLLGAIRAILGKSEVEDARFSAWQLPKMQRTIIQMLDIDAVSKSEYGWVPNAITTAIYIRVWLGFMHLVFPLALGTAALGVLIILINGS